MKIAIIIKILDIIHDVLCPFFKDNKDKKEDKTNNQ
jgi:hypothetical protein